MQTKKITITLLAVNFFISSCGVSIQTNHTATPTPVIITATLPPTQTPRPSETPLPATPQPTITSIEGRTSTQLNIRSEPSTAGEVIGIIPANSAVQIIGRDAGENWWLILYPQANSGKGWVTAQYVETAGRPEVPVMRGDGSVPSNGNNGVVIQQLNIRSGPGTNFDSIGILNVNDAVTLTGKNRGNSWLQIEYAAGSDGKGWVNAGYVRTDRVDILPIVSELGDVIGTVTMLDTPLPSTPTLVPASMDFDSADAPLRSVVFEAAGITSLLYNGDISAPSGDIEDWLAITPYTNAILITIQCVGSATIQIDIGEIDQPFECNSGQQIVHVLAGKKMLIHVLAISNSGELQYASYTISIFSMP